jgi:hypothetical protein
VSERRWIWLTVKFIEGPAYRYYAFVALLLVLRTGALIWTTVTTHPSFVNTAAGLIGDLLGFVFGMAFGLAARRRDARLFLADPSLLGAFYFALAFTFALNGIRSALAMAPVTGLFTQSGYSIAFLKFIAIVEAIGGLDPSIPFLAAGDFPTIEAARDELCPKYRTYLPQPPEAEVNERLLTIFSELYRSLGTTPSPLCRSVMSCPFCAPCHASGLTCRPCRLLHERLQMN